MTVDSINGVPATWQADYENHQSAAYSDLTQGLLDVVSIIIIKLTGV